MPKVVMAKKKQVRKLFWNYDGNFPSPRELAKRNNQIKLVRQTDLLGGRPKFDYAAVSLHSLLCHSTTIIKQHPSSANC